MKRPVGLIGVALLVGSCLGQADRYVDRATLLNDPAAQLRPAAVIELLHAGSDRITTIDGPQPAFDAYLLGTQVTDIDVYGYYDSELRRLGWIPDRFVGSRSTTELKAWGWCKATLDFRLGIQDQRVAFEPSFLHGQTFTTVFDARIVSRDRSLGCPYQPSPSSR